jgi:hypothetical protein
VLLPKYFSGKQIAEKEIRGTHNTYVAEERCMRILVGKPDRKRPLARSGRKWKYNIKMDLQEEG